MIRTDIKIDKPIYAQGGAPVYQFGCSRFLFTDGEKTGDGLLGEVGAEVSRYGKKPLIIGGNTALGLTREVIQKSLEKAGIIGIFKVYSGPCTLENVNQLLDGEDIDVIVGVGGGRIMDMSKLCAYVAKVPVVNIPTSSATCAAVSSLSVLYDAKGKTVGTLCYEQGVNSVITDVSVIRTQPRRLAVAGILDTMAKRLEIEHYQLDEPGLLAAKILAQNIFQNLYEKKDEDIRKTIYYCIPLTGVISGLSRGRNQSHLGHGLYEAARKIFTEECEKALHGELVGIGLFLQLAFDNRQSEIEKLREYMRQLSMPLSLPEVGIADTQENRKKLYDAMLNSPYLEKNEKYQERLKTALNFVWR